MVSINFFFSSADPSLGQPAVVPIKGLPAEGVSVWFILAFDFCYRLSIESMN